MTRTSAKVNLLLVFLIGVLGFVVLALLFPTFAGDGIGAVSTRCLSNMKQVGVAAYMYCADYDGRLMDRDQWIDQLVPYAKKEELFHCPAVTEASDHKTPSYGYSMHGRLSGVKAEMIPRPEEVILIFESSSLWRNASDNLQSLPEPPRAHGKGRSNAVIYLDTHSKRLRTNALIRGTQR